MSDFRCSRASFLRDEPLAGTASTVRAFLLVEYAGAWGADALRDARLPEGVGQRLQRLGAAAGVRVLLTRRPASRSTQPERVTVLAASADPDSPWLERGQLPEVSQVLDLDLSALRAGRSVGLDRIDTPVYAVCTHGKHDACCAERGRPVARALAAAHAEETWEVSHIGGDRFAANLVVLPHGLYYGRLTAVSAMSVAGAHRSGRLDLDHFRGRSGYPMTVQTAEVALRKQTGETALDAVRLLDTRRSGEITRARFVLAGSTYEVDVRTTQGPRHQLTCDALRDDPVPLYGVESIVVSAGSG